jgi:hypothetical protein
VRSRAWAWLLLVPACAFGVVVATSPFVLFHPQLSFAGSPDRFVDAVVRAGRSDARAALWIDNVFLVSWLVTVPRLVGAGLDRWAAEERRANALWMASPRLAVAAAVAGLVGNGLALFAAGKSEPPVVVTWSVAASGVVSLVLFVVAMVSLLVLVIGPTGRYLVRRDRRGG